MGGNHDFCRVLLASVRADLDRETRPIGGSGMSYADLQPIPRKLTALRTFRDHYTVEGEPDFSVEVEGCCAFAARARALSDWLEGARERERQQVEIAVRLAFEAWTRARTKVARCRRPASLTLARQQEAAAERAYRSAAARRDALVDGAR